MVLVSLCFGRYINSTDIDTSKFWIHLNNAQVLRNKPGQIDKALVREALYHSLGDSLNSHADRVGEHIFGETNDREIYAFKISKDYVESLGTTDFNTDTVNTHFVGAQTKIAKFVDDFKVNVVESVLKQSIEQNLLEPWHNSPEAYERMREKPFVYYLDYKTYAWLKAFDGNSTLWDEQIQKFDE
mmetsp:Transcript_30725/g.35154  ORF Transcript_30725/g.35154 Transcript_30725/m.35154 type:complete len:185 (-) Transcript_30725:42-596(-)